MTATDVRLATSRYQAYELILSSGLVPVRITLGAPRWKLPYAIEGRISLIAPTRSLFAQRGDPGFEDAYVAQLEAHGVDAISREIHTVSQDHNGRGLVLLCFEDVFKLGESSCHRRMFARWWESKTAQRVDELPATPIREGPL